MQGQPWLDAAPPPCTRSSGPQPESSPSELPSQSRPQVTLEPAGRTIALLGLPSPVQGRIFFNPASDDEIEDSGDAEDTFQDVEATQFSPTRLKPGPTLDLSAGPPPAQASSSTSPDYSTPPPRRKSSEDADNERAAWHLRSLTNECPSPP